MANYAGLLVASRNLDFFTSFYRFLIQLVPAAVVAPLFFSGKIEFGVINQSQSAFNHILGDVSLVVYQFQAIAGFSAVVDRLGQFQEVVDDKVVHQLSDVSTANGSKDAGAPEAQLAADSTPVIEVAGSAPEALSSSASQQIRFSNLPQHDGSLLRFEDVCISTPNGQLQLVQNLTADISGGNSLLIMGPSGSGKTSVLRTVAGLWQSGSGTLVTYGLPGLGSTSVVPGSVLFLPQKPYMVLGCLRDQLLYPTWLKAEPTSGSNGSSSSGNGAAGASDASGNGVQSEATTSRPVPSDDDLEQVGCVFFWLGEVVQARAHHWWCLVWGGRRVGEGLMLIIFIGWANLLVFSCSLFMLMILLLATDGRSLRPLLLRPFTHYRWPALHKATNHSPTLPFTMFGNVPDRRPFKTCSSVRCWSA